MFNTAANPWPSGSDGNPTINGWCGYGCRPDVDIDAAIAANEQLPKLRQFHNEAILSDLTATPERADDFATIAASTSSTAAGRPTGSSGIFFDDQPRSMPGVTAVTANPFQDEIFRRLDSQ